MEGNTFYFNWEVALIEWLQAHMGSFGTMLASGVSSFGEELVLIAILGFLYWCYDKEYGKYVGTIMVAAIVANPLIKNLFLRRRPYFDNAGIKCLKPVEAEADIYDIAAQGYSFPSGHSMNAATAYSSIAVYGKKRWLYIVAAILIVTVGVSRFCLGVHYPTDVLIGWLCGFIMVALISLVYKKVSDTRIIYLIMALIGAIGLLYCKSEDYFTAYGLMIGVFLAFMFEAKYVNFSCTRVWYVVIFRIAAGMLLFVILNTVLKLPFPKEFLENGSFAAHLVRLFRYLITGFIVVGVYPMVFNKINLTKK